jgi:hypothetical protein
MSARRNKYNAVRQYSCGECGIALRPDLAVCPTHGGGSVIKFDSKAEARRWDELRLLQRAGTIGGPISRQYPFTLKTWAGGLETPQEIGKYIADFMWFEPETGQHHYEDVKGFDTPLSKWKRKHCELQYGIKIEVIKA